MFTSREAGAFLCFRLKPTLERVSPPRDGMFTMASEYFALTFSCFGGSSVFPAIGFFSYIIATAHTSTLIYVFCVNTSPFPSLHPPGSCSNTSCQHNADASNYETLLFRCCFLCSRSEPH